MKRKKMKRKKMERNKQNRNNNNSQHKKKLMKVPLLINLQQMIDQFNNQFKNLIALNLAKKNKIKASCRFKRVIQIKLIKAVILLILKINQIYL